MRNQVKKGSNHVLLPAQVNAHVNAHVNCLKLLHFCWYLDVKTLGNWIITYVCSHKNEVETTPKHYIVIKYQPMTESLFLIGKHT